MGVVSSPIKPFQCHCFRSYFSSKGRTPTGKMAFLPRFLNKPPILEEDENKGISFVSPWNGNRRRKIKQSSEPNQNISFLSCLFMVKIFLCFGDLMAVEKGGFLLDYCILRKFCA